jgi:hypothetical protein
MKNHASEIIIKETLPLKGVGSDAHNELEILNSLKRTTNTKLRQNSSSVENRGMIFVDDNSFSVSTTLPKPIKKALSLLNTTHDAAAAVISTASILKASRQAEDGNINEERLAISETADVKNKPLAQTHIDLFSDNKELMYSQIQIAELIEADADTVFRNRLNDAAQNKPAFSTNTREGVVGIDIDSSPHTAGNVALLYAILGTEENCKNTLEILSLLPENTNKVAALFNANKVQVADLVGQENTEALGTVITRQVAAPVLALAA